MTESERNIYEATSIPLAFYSYRDGKVITDLVIKIKMNNIDKTLKSGANISQIELARKKNDLRNIKIRL